MNWLNAAKNNLFPVSVEQANLSTALLEWEYRGTPVDLGEAFEVCELCGHPDIRYQFPIVNKKNGNVMLVGSECIKRFTIGVLDESGKVLNEIAARLKIDKDRRKLILDSQTQSLLNSLVELSTKDQKFEIASFINWYKEHGSFTPLQLFTMFWRLEELQVKFSAHYFKLSIRRPKDKTQLLSLPEWKIRKLWPALNPTQRKLVQKELRLDQRSAKL
jgi:hypothetical protein